MKGKQIVEGQLRLPPEEKLLEIAGERVFERGRKYYLKGMVGEIIVAEDRVMATVEGSGSNVYSGPSGQGKRNQPTTAHALTAGSASTWSPCCCAS